VYLLDQSRLSEASSDELRDMDAQVVDLEKRIKVEDANLKNLMTELKELNSSLTTEEAKAEVETVRMCLSFSFLVTLGKLLVNLIQKFLENSHIKRNFLHRAQSIRDAL